MAEFTISEMQEMQRALQEKYKDKWEPICAEIGLDRVLITCNDDNIGSEKTILANGGVYESTIHEPNENEYLKRFWIEL